MNMKRICVAFLAASFFFMGNVYGADQNISLSIDGREIVFSEADNYGVPFIDSSGRTQVPIRKPLEAIGAVVNYVDAEKEIVIEKDNTHISLTIDGDMYVNGWRRPIDTSATLHAGRSYMPIRFVFEELGYSVRWDASSSSVNIEKRQDTMVRKSEVADGWGLDGASAMMSYNAEIGLNLPCTYRDSDEIPVMTADEFYIGSIFIYNRGNRNIILESYEIEMKIFKINTAGEDLIHSVKLSPASGEIPVNYAMITADAISQPNNLEPGIYRIEYDCSDTLVYTYADDSDGAINYLKTEYAVFRPFDATFTLI